MKNLTLVFLLFFASILRGYSQAPKAVLVSKNFKFTDGDICTTSNHTDKYAFMMLLDIAEKFGVSIQGEEGEVYTIADTESFGTYAEMNSTHAVHRDTQLSSIADELKSLKTAKHLYRVLLVVCIVSVAGIVLLPFVIFRLRQIIKKTTMLNKM